MKSDARAQWYKRRVGVMTSYPLRGMGIEQMFYYDPDSQSAFGTRHDTNTREPYM